MYNNPSNDIENKSFLINGLCQNFKDYSKKGLIALTEQCNNHIIKASKGTKKGKVVAGLTDNVFFE